MIFLSFSVNSTVAFTELCSSIPIKVVFKSVKRSLISIAKPLNKMQDPTKSDNAHATTESAQFNQTNCKAIEVKYPIGVFQFHGILGKR